MASKNWILFSDWAVGRPANDFIPYMNEKRDDFNYRALGRAANNMPEAGIRQNNECRDFLKGIQEQLIVMGHMVPRDTDRSLNKTDDNKSTSSKKKELTNAERRDYERLKEDFIRVTEELRNANAALKRFRKMEEYLMEFGVLPR